MGEGPDAHSLFFLSLSFVSPFNRSPIAPSTLSSFVGLVRGIVGRLVLVVTCRGVLGLAERGGWSFFCTVIRNPFRDRGPKVDIHGSAVVPVSEEDDLGGMYFFRSPPQSFRKLVSTLTFIRLHLQVRHATLPAKRIRYSRPIVVGGDGDVAARRRRVRRCDGARTHEAVDRWIVPGGRRRSPPATSLPSVSRLIENFTSARPSLAEPVDFSTSAFNGNRSA